MEIGDGNAANCAVGLDRLHSRVERAHCHRHIARMCRDAGVADPDHGMRSAESPQRSTPAAGLAFVARLIGVVEIRTSRALKQVPGRGRLVAQLAGGARQQRSREQAIIPPHARIGGEIGVAHQGADAQPSVRCRLDLVERKSVYVDQMRGRFDLQLHQVDQVGSAGDELCAADPRGRRRSFRGRFRTLVSKGFHARLPLTSVIASMMFE
jgi:hypothetical protein